MRAKFSLSSKILSLAFLNLVLLVLVFSIFGRSQLRFDPSSFLLTSARDRMMSVSRLIALELPDHPAASWTQLLTQFSSTYPAEFFLFNNDGRELAGRPTQLPPALLEHLRRNTGPPAWMFHQEKPRKLEDMVFPSPMVLVKAGTPAQYWAGIHIPVRNGSAKEPIHGTLVWSFPSLWTNSFFFDYRPWLVVVLAVVLVSSICWLPLIQGMTRSISQITRATGQIAEGKFDISLPTKRRDELGLLSGAINRMAARLSGYVNGQRRFLSDIAHELCSPVARIQMALGILEQRAQENQREYVADLQEEVQHMSGLLNQLLSFSKAQINAGGAQLTEVNVADTVSRVLQREASEHAHIETHIGSNLAVMADGEYLFRSIANLVRNAVRYAGDAGPITVSASNGNGMVSIVVADHGPGLPESELEHIFKPFYRPEFARQRETGGTGLGLAIVRSCVEACGGVVQCRNRPGKGLEAEIRLPAPAA